MNFFKLILNLEKVEPPPEDLVLKDLVPMPDEKKNPIPITGLILINYPTNEDQINALKEYNINLNKVYNNKYILIHLLKNK